MCLDPGVPRRPPPASAAPAAPGQDKQRSSADRPSAESSELDHPGEGYIHETETLKLNCNKACNQLNWKPIWGREIMFEKTFEWYKEFYLEQKVNTEKQLEDYLKAAVKEKLSWVK